MMWREREKYTNKLQTTDPRDTNTSKTSHISAENGSIHGQMTSVLVLYYNKTNVEDPGIPMVELTGVSPVIAKFVLLQFLIWKRSGTSDFSTANV
eukprot:scaffold1976_cov187-Alexandrium_tamarense.AAC.12